MNTLFWVVDFILDEDMKPRIKGKTKMYVLGLLLNLTPEQQLYVEKISRGLPW